MDLNKIPIFSMLTEKMAWLSRRQKVLAQNVANADTPGYKARDLDKPDFRKLIAAASGGRVGMAMNRAGHLAGSVRTGGERAVIDKSSPETAPNGNSVDLPAQMMKIGETQMDFTTAASLYSKHVRLIKIAMGRDR